MKPQKVYRNASVLPMSGLLVLTGVVIGVLAATTAKHGQVAGVAIGVVAAACGVRWSRAGIWIEAEGVKLAGFLLRIRKISWAELDHFAVQPFGRYPAVAYAVLKNGRRYPALAVCSTTKVNPSVGKSTTKVQHAVDELNQVVESRRQSSVALASASASGT